MPRHSDDQMAAFLTPRFCASFATLGSMVLLGPRREEKPVAQKVGAERRAPGWMARFARAFQLTPQVKRFAPEAWQFQRATSVKLLSSALRNPCRLFSRHTRP